MMEPTRAIEPPDYDEAMLYAVRAFADGKANDGQQKLVFDWIIKSACALNGWAYCMGGDDGRRATDLLLGRQFVAHVLYDMLQPKALARLKAKEAMPRTRRAARKDE